jgi:hypothetical protein
VWEDIVVNNLNLAGSALLLAATVYAAQSSRADLLPPTPVPFRVIDNKIAVPATIDGNGPYELAIDCGAETMSISQAVVDACKLTVTDGDVEVSGTTGAYTPAGHVAVSNVRIGGVEVDNPYCTVSAPSTAVDGYLGAPRFNFYTVQINMANDTITCYPPNGYTPDPSDIAVPITLGLHRVPVVQGLIGATPASLEVDTGSSFPAELYSKVVQAGNLTESSPYLGQIGSRSIGGPIVAPVYGLDSISVNTALQVAAPATNDNPVAPAAATGTAGATTAAPPPPAAPSVAPAQPMLTFKGRFPAIFYPDTVINTGDWDGRLGEPFFANMVLTFDYAHKLLYIRPSVPPRTSAPPAEGVTAAPASPSSDQPAGGSTPVAPTAPQETK